MRIDRQLDELERKAREQGFRVQRTASGHRRFLAPDGKGLVHVGVGGDHARALKNTVASLRRIGLDLGDRPNEPLPEAEENTPVPPEEKYMHLPEPKRPEPKKDRNQTAMLIAFGRSVERVFAASEEDFKAFHGLLEEAVLLELTLPELLEALKVS